MEYHTTERYCKALKQARVSSGHLGCNFKSSQRSRPTEVTSKRPVSRKRTVVEVPKVVSFVVLLTWVLSLMIELYLYRYLGILGFYPLLGSFLPKSSNKTLPSLLKITNESLGRWRRRWSRHGNYLPIHHETNGVNVSMRFTVWNKQWSARKVWWTRTAWTEYLERH